MISIHQLHKMNTYIDATWTLALGKCTVFSSNPPVPCLFLSFWSYINIFGPNKPIGSVSSQQFEYHDKKNIYKWLKVKMAQINPQGVFPANSLNTMIGKLYRNG